MNTQDTDNVLIISLYVNDLIYTRNNEKMIGDFKKDMVKMFKMIDLRLMHYFLRIEINQQKDGIHHSEQIYRKSHQYVQDEWLQDSNTLRQ